ncbi:MAG: DUF3098 domain-containing protein [Muribaculaceae bacterium]|nr:DUF3098 domain-containing protein [Muribaculaceae bacterium]
MADYRKTTGKAPNAKDARLEKEAKADYPLVKQNFVWMGISAALIILGFLLMLGSSSTEEFNPDIFSGWRIVVGPTIAFIGFVAMGVAIIWRPKK